ncbi:hypothetical protein RRG08_003479 [Elysia crispata]|uniref:C2H2-type domain-containing protein n=1 Tax=Elysia crispata TaxID=231223 RepID=A0AAE0Y812_9GAST|nr:hypothetical protein RRG08_003479 [Elysia crispata]
MDLRDLLLFVDGERKYMCKFCDRGFKQLSHLQKHISVHTEVTDGSLQQLAPTKGKRGRKAKRVEASEQPPEPTMIHMN